MKKTLDSHSFAKKAIKNSISEAIKKGKNPFSGKRFTKSEAKQLAKLTRVVK